MPIRRTLGVLLCALSVSLFAQTALAQTSKPKITLDEFFDAIDFIALKVAPDGSSVVINAERNDWNQQIICQELWLYRISGDGGNLVQLTHAARDTNPAWSPDGRWVAFLSERKVASAKDGDGDGEDKNRTSTQLYLVSPDGGEALAVTSGEEDVHAFAWAPDGKSLYFATREVWSKQQSDQHRQEWKDVIRFRGDDRGDAIYRILLADTLARRGKPAVAEADSTTTPGAVEIARVSSLRVSEMTISHDGRQMAFVTNSPSERQESTDEIEIYAVALNGNSAAIPKRVTHNEAIELNLAWTPDDRHIWFQINLGALDHKYDDAQPRLYWIDPSNGHVERWFADFQGEVKTYTPLADGTVLCSCRTGTEVQLVAQRDPKAPVVERAGWAGTYEYPAAVPKSSRIAFVYSAIERPDEVYLAEGADKITQARPLTSFNKLFTERDLPKAKPYRWKSDDGLALEGMLMYPPGKFGAKNLPMLVLIHGGPQDADGNHFEADYYQWDRLAATAGWLVFEPNYRGSTGYGDEFALSIVPDIFSKPGRDILSGVDALVRDGIADANHLTIGGNSYGGYLTNWLLTQTTRFKAAVTSAGGVENVADWGNDDSTVDDRYYLGGDPWENPDRYHREAAIYHIDQVKTPTLIVTGGADIRVPPMESYLLDRALHELNVPSELLIFPGEDHALSRNPWHAKIKVREELKWLSKYGGVGN